MNALEALTRLIALSDETLGLNSTLHSEVPELSDQERELQLASSVCQAMLNTALPIARFRAHADVDPVQPRLPKSYKDKKRPTSSYVISSVDMDGILSGLMGLTHVPTQARITVWEQRATGADMISGFQGLSRSSEYRLWLQSLLALEVKSSMQ